ncbi:MAG: histidine kinase [Betaproteobacteria bacterium HGW-Betaproteobacteria-7]|jgi:two-component system sensor histidine kinase UhpB|nr:MAG: histidine kinase [Betaproteobacteria bacterium HGW-Betaproteobacteria-7]
MRRRLSLYSRIGLVLTGLAASLLLVLAGIWLHGARQGIHEEVEAASRVSEQWLTVLASELQAAPAERLLAVVRPLGRIRANELQVIAADGSLLYRSPPPTYKAGRSVPAWFAGLLQPQLTPRQLLVGNLRLVLQPDASRSVIDAWDDLLALAGWALALLGLLFVAIRQALALALRPLGLVMQALDRTGRGRFDTRLPVFATAELARLSSAFNGMSDRLQVAVDDNVRLETEHELAHRMQARLEDERRQIARELHDELAQGITAVRALAGAIVQRTADQPALFSPAQSIVAVTGEMQDGVKAILHRLRPLPGAGFGGVLEQRLAAWRRQHPDIALQATLHLGDAPLADELAQTALRIIQEGLTNVVRHAGASRVELSLTRHAGKLQVSLADNGRGCDGRPSAAAGSGFGLAGMAERVADCGGTLAFTNPGGGFGLLACLPEQPTTEEIS